ncbi:hypothetical protein L3i20_v208940 [Paenibacillus sp. L3-i20]|nr:hypothetical protein L3i20_v208940 [Paenibacillus sp. L3-i20]
MKNCTYVISLLVLGLIILGFNYVNKNTKARNLQASIDTKFKIELSDVRDNFVVVINDYKYRTVSVLSSISNVATISELTSYKEQNDNYK